jgi:hypothetical protein
MVKFRATPSMLLQSVVELSGLSRRFYREIVNPQ